MRDDLRTHDQIMAFVLAAGSNDSSFGAPLGSYGLQQDPREVTSLLLFLLRNKPKIGAFLEIGCAEGGNSRLMCDVLDIEDVAHIDLGEAHFAEKLAVNLGLLLNSGRLERHVGDSRRPEACGFLSRLGWKYDYVFIDGDHSYEGVQRDTMLVLPWLAKDALVGFHDSEICPGVRKWTDELKCLSHHELAHVGHFQGRCGVDVFRYTGD
jgi:predicted O-methyltransferase YrrM